MYCMISEPTSAKLLILFGQTFSGLYLPCKEGGNNHTYEMKPAYYDSLARTKWEQWEGGNAADTSTYKGAEISLHMLRNKGGRYLHTAVIYSKDKRHLLMHSNEPQSSRNFLRGEKGGGMFLIIICLLGFFSFFVFLLLLLFFFLFFSWKQSLVNKEGKRC